jgi:NADP-dependent 3-hydroxy acid dehydrogenase YdfG
MNDSSRRLAGKLAVVTGASAGIGRATAIALADAGASVVATGRRRAELQSLADECRGRGGGMRHFAGDITDRRFVAELAAHASDAEILVNNAGILTYAPLLEMAAAETEAMFGVNVLAAIEISQRFGRIMVERRRGHIVIITSTAARTIGPLRAVYGATKHALAGIAKGLRIELKPYGIKVTEIAPGMVDTGIRDRNTHPEALVLFKDQAYPPLTAQDVAEAVVYALTTSPTCCPDYIELRPPGA